MLAVIALFGGGLQMYLGEPETNPRLDNIHRFMAGVYFSMRPLFHTLLKLPLVYLFIKKGQQMGNPHEQSHSFFAMAI